MTEQIELNRLAELETVIERGQQTFIEVGLALAEIREQRLYREGFDSFEDYCRERWGWQRNYANKLIASVNAVNEMSTIVPKTDLLPVVQNEGQARELAKIKDPEIRSQVWRQVNEMASEVETVVTAKLVKEAVEVQKQIELRENGNESALPVGFPTVNEFKAEMKNTPGAKWNDTLYNILVTTNSIRDNGGIAHLSSRWTPAQKIAYLEKLQRLQNTLAAIAAELQENIEYAEI